MPRLYLMELLLLNLKGDFWEGCRGYVSKKEAYEGLKYHTGQDFGYDVDKWEAWLKEHPDSIRIPKPSEHVKRRMARMRERVDSKLPPEP